MILLKVKEDVLRALVELEMSSNPHFKLFKEWLTDEYNRYVKMAAFGVNLPAEQMKAFQGMACILNDLVEVIQHPKAIIEEIAMKRGTKASG